MKQKEHTSLIHVLFGPRSTEKHLCVFHRKENTWKWQRNSDDFLKFPRQGFSCIDRTACISSRCHLAAGVTIQILHYKQPKLPWIQNLALNLYVTTCTICI